ncbi:DUF6364 family protein [Ferruginibacter sp.]|nr:hypothetical protein [Ferruginibacter sp.]
MDAKITLSFDETVIKKAKNYAENNNISLSRLTEFLLVKASTGNYKSLEDFPIADWVKDITEGKAEFKRKGNTSKKLAKEYFNSKR